MDKDATGKLGHEVNKGYAVLAVCSKTKNLAVNLTAMPKAKEP
jgi:hypothetical protein